MTINGKTASFIRDEKRAQNPAGHPPVVFAGKVKANDGVYPTGAMLKYDADGITLIPFVTAGNAVVGALDQQIDTAVNQDCNYVRHGGVIAENLLVKDGNGDFVAPSQADLMLFQAAGIFPG